MTSERLVIGPPRATIQVTDVYAEVRLEQLRAAEIYGPQHDLADGTNTELAELAHQAKAEVAESHAAGQLTWLELLMEEAAEAAAEVDPVPLRREAIQVAATAIRWVEAIDARHPWSASAQTHLLTGDYEVEVRRGEYLVETLTITKEQVDQGARVVLDPYRPGHLRVVQPEVTP